MKTKKYHGIVYRHLNKITGKSYIGQTTKKTTQRFRKGNNNFTSYKGSPIFYGALQKYGWEVFDTQELVYCFNQADLNEMEAHYINVFNSLAPNGYNSVARVKETMIFSEEAKQKMSEAAIKHDVRQYLPEDKRTKTPHTIVDGVESKICSVCKVIKSLGSFGAYKYSWDGLNRTCQSCHRDRARDYRKKNPYKGLSPEEYAESRKQAAITNSKSQKERFKNNPDQIENLRKKRSKPLMAIDIHTGDVFHFESALKAKEAGFQNTNIGLAIKHNKPYRGYIWKFCP